MLSEDAAKSLIEPHKAVLATAIRGGIDDWGSLLSLDGAGSLTAGLTTRTRASYVHERIVNRLVTAETNGKCHGMRVRKAKGGAWLAIISDQLVLKLKKLDLNLKSSNIPTGQSELFARQRELPGTGVSDPTNAEAGYVLRVLAAAPQRLVVVCWDGRLRHWTIELDDEGGGTGSVNPMITLPGGPAGGRTRTRIVEPAAEEEEGDAQ